MAVRVMNQLPDQVDELRGALSQGTHALSTTGDLQTS
jgi:hypothetical protein